MFRFIYCPCHVNGEIEVREEILRPLNDSGEPSRHDRIKLAIDRFQSQAPLPNGPYRVGL